MQRKGQSIEATLQGLSFTVNNRTVHLKVMPITSAGRLLSIARPKLGSHSKMKLNQSQVCNSSPLYKTYIFDLDFLQQKKNKIKGKSSMKVSKSKLQPRLKY